MLLVRLRFRSRRELAEMVVAVRPVVLHMVIAGGGCASGRNGHRARTDDPPPVNEEIFGLPGGNFCSGLDLGLNRGTRSAAVLLALPKPGDLQRPGMLLICPGNPHKCLSAVLQSLCLNFFRLPHEHG
jgi:hypothetical protein